MEYVSGQSLEHVMAETPQGGVVGPLPSGVETCAGAIDYVHERGIVHGDIKPGNIMVQDDGQPKILDFGLARIAHQTKITQQGSIAGTLILPRAGNGEGGPASPQADQYALAVIAYQLATGVLPFVADSAYAVLYKVVTEAPTAVNEINPRIPGVVADSISRALSKDPANRFKTCMQFVSQLSQPGASIISQASAPWRWYGGVIASALKVISSPLAMIWALFGKSETATEETPSPPPSPARVPVPAPVAAPSRPIASEQTRILRLPVDSRLDPQELARRQATELVELARTESFDAVVVLQGKWLPGVEGADATLLAFREAARYLVAARNASSPHNAVEHLTRAEAALMAAGYQLLGSQGPAAVEMPAALEIWKDYTRTNLPRAGN